MGRWADCVGGCVRECAGGWDAGREVGCWETVWMLRTANAHPRTTRRPFLLVYKFLLRYFCINERACDLKRPLVYMFRRLQNVPHQTFTAFPGLALLQKTLVYKFSPSATPQIHRQRLFWQKLSGSPNSHFSHTKDLYTKKSGRLVGLARP